MGFWVQNLFRGPIWNSAPGLELFLRCHSFEQSSLVAVSVSVKSRCVTVKGPRGTLRRNFRHMTVDMKMLGKKKMLVEKWMGIRKELAAVRTICSHIENMIKGVIYVRSNHYYYIGIFIYFLIIFYNDKACVALVMIKPVLPGW